MLAIVHRTDGRGDNSVKSLTCSPRGKLAAKKRWAKIHLFALLSNSVRVELCDRVKNFRVLIASLDLHIRNLSEQVLI